MATMTTILGIDLGTTNSLGAVFRGSGPVMIPNALGQFLTPSVVAVMPDGEIVVGAAARDYRVTHPDRCVSRFKQWMGSDRDVMIGGRRFTPSELSSLVLRSIKEDAESFLQHTVTDAVITVPAYFNDSQRRATKQAGQLAGLTVRRIINEPTAAALAYGYRDKDAEKHIVVLDLGGGTFDVTLMEVFDGSLEIVATAGENFLGGEEFTDRLTADVYSQMGMHIEKAELERPLQVARLRQFCEIAKRQLFDSDAVKITVPDIDGQVSKAPRQIDLTREKFSELSRPLLQRLRGPIQKVLRDGHRLPSEVDEVILVGGATRMRVLQELVASQLECEPHSELNPDEVVAQGAAIQAALITDDAAVEDMVMTDVCPHTLGVECAKEFGARIQDGYFVPIIHRNTTIPVSQEQTLYTIAANQGELLISVFQGESRRVQDNHQLGELVIKNIPPGPKGMPVVIRFTYDIDGILEVEAFVENSDERFSTVIASNQSLSEEELKAARDRMSEFKFYPRDDEWNRHLLNFAERAVGESDPIRRQQLEEAVDLYENALSAGSRDFFEKSKLHLLQTLSLLGFPFDE